MTDSLTDRLNDIMQKSHLPITVDHKMLRRVL